MSESHRVTRIVQDPHVLSTELVLEGEHELLHAEVKNGNTHLIFKQVTPSAASTDEPLMSP